MPITDIKYLIKSFLLLFLFGFSSMSIAQNNERIEALKVFTDTARQNNELVDSLIELVYLLSRSEINTAMPYADRACKVATAEGYEKGIGNCFVHKGIIYEGLGKYDEARAFYESAKTKRLELSDFQGTANAISNIGLCYYYQELPEKAIAQYNVALKYLRNEPISKSNGQIYSNIADAYILSIDYKASLIYLDSSIQVWDKIEDLHGQANTLVSSGILNSEFNDLEKAEKDFQNSLQLYNKLNDDKGKAVAYIELGNLDFKKFEFASASVMYERAEDLDKALRLSDKAYLQFNQGIIAKETNNLEKAIAYFKDSQSAFEQDQDTWSLASVNYELGNIAHIQKEYALAETYYLKGLEYCKNECDLSTQELVHTDLSKVYFQLGDLKKAYKHSIHSNLIRDSIAHAFLNASKYQTEFAEIQKVKGDFEIDRLESEKRVLWNRALLITLVLGTFLTILIFYGYRNKKRRQISEYKTEQAYMEIDDILRNKELEITYAQLDAKDAIQKQIGQDLHDRLGMMLSTIKLYFTEFSEQLNELKTDTSQKQHKTIELLDEAVNEVRRISHDMQSGVLKKFGLVSAVQDLADTIEQSDRMKVIVNAHGLKERIPNKLEVKIYKIVQELISNVLKHSQAKNLAIYLHLQDELFNLIVEDDGIGFNQDAISERDGMGLKNITYRVTELNGKCHFDTSPGKGTSVIIDIPI